MGQATSRGPSPPEDRRRSRPLPWLRPSSSNHHQHSLSAETSQQSRQSRQSRSRARSRPQSTVLFTTPPDDPPDDPPVEEPVSQTSTIRRRSRLLRASRTLSVQVPHLFSRHSSSNSQHTSGSITNTHTSRETNESGSGDGPRQPSVPHLHLPELDVSFDDITPSEPLLRPNARRQSLRPTSFSERFPLLRPDRGLRNMTTSLRRRSPARRGEDQAAMLSRLLSVAAAATAASLMGGDQRAVSEARNVAGDGEDGTFDSFLEALQNGRIASALRQSGSEMEEGPGGSAAPLNFFRMFRFGSSNVRTRNDGHGQGQGNFRSASRNSTHGNNNERIETQGTGEEEGADGRMVPIIIVGIRSISPSNQGNQDDGNIPPFLDALSSFPTPVTQQGEAAVEGALRQPRNGTTFSHRRRASMGGLSTFPSPYDRQRHQRSPERTRPWSTIADSPAGPRPPPTTPASPGLSTLSSGNSTPAMAATPSGLEAQSSASSRRTSLVRRQAGSTLDPTPDTPPLRQRATRQRRMSDSDFARFGSGSSRRNGVVEPDNSPGEGSRSWIIYVLGGSYPENHPILTTPSLFSDSPTYEDMLLLSSLLGPVKPPVASESDVEASGGLLTIQSIGGRMVAGSPGGEGDVILLALDGRCLVCLCDFESGDEARKLQKCGHIFHRECIDQWLLTGRNSCPLCRGQGVEEKSQERTSSSEESTSTSTASTQTPATMA